LAPDFRRAAFRFFGRQPRCSWLRSFGRVLAQSAYGPRRQAGDEPPHLGARRRHGQNHHRAQHIDGENLNSTERAADWAARHSIDREAWLRSYNSPEVDQKVKQAIAATRQYSIQGTPSLVVDGRYLTSTGMNASIGDVIRVLDDLVQLAREQHAAGAR